MNRISLYELIISSFIELKSIALSDEGRIHVPHTRLGVQRLSEQELKQIFIHNLVSSEKFLEYSYSIETPTKFRYQFIKGPNDSGEIYIFNSESHKGRSANIDLTIHKNRERICIIEFKYGNPGHFSHAKDFAKLDNEPVANNGLRLFIEFYASTDEATLNNIHSKLHHNKVKYNSNLIINNKHLEGKTVNIGHDTIYIGYTFSHCNDNIGGVILDSQSLKFIDSTTSNLKTFII